MKHTYDIQGDFPLSSVRALATRHRTNVLLLCLVWCVYLVYCVRDFFLKAGAEEKAGEKQSLEISSSGKKSPRSLFKLRRLIDATFTGAGTNYERAESVRPTRGDWLKLVQNGYTPDEPVIHT